MKMRSSNARNMLKDLRRIRRAHEVIVKQKHDYEIELVERQAFVDSNYGECPKCKQRFNTKEESIEHITKCKK